MKIVDVKPAKKGRKEKPWRLHSKEFTGRFEIDSRRGSPRILSFEIYAIYLYTYRKKAGPRHFRDYLEQKEERRSTSLNNVLEDLRISDKERALMDMLNGGLSSIERLLQRHFSLMKMREEQDLKERRIEYAKNKIKWAERKAHEKRAKKPKQFSRKVEV